MFQVSRDAHPNERLKGSRLISRQTLREFAMSKSELLELIDDLSSRGTTPVQQLERIKDRLKLRELHTLGAVVQAGSMAKAAAHLALSQSAVSKAITEMEHTLGVPLLERMSRGVEPTPYARILLKRSVVIFDELSEGLKEIEYLTDPAGAEVRIGTTEPMAAIVATVVDRLSRQYPRMTFHVIVSNSTPVLLSGLRERDLDLALFRVPSTKPAKDLTSEILFHDPLVVVAGQHNRWTRRRRVELADLMAEPWVLPLPEGGIGHFVVEAFHSRGLAVPRSAVITPSIHMRHNMLVTGRFLSILPNAMLKFPTYRGTLRALSIDLAETRRPIGLITLKKRELSPGAKLFANCAREVVRPLANKV
jgi:DNA-binding transcriptional LysR family regulator